MEAFFKTVLEYILDYLSRYSFFITWEYYEGLLEHYFSGPGFMLGLGFVLLIYFSSAEEQHKAGFFKVVPVVAVINSCNVLAAFLDTTFRQGFGYYGVDAMINAPDNIISGFILTLVISSCYRRYGGRAFLFGTATHLALPLLNFYAFEFVSGPVPLVHMILRVLLIGLLCLIMSRRKHFFTSWIWYFGFHMLLRILVFLLPMVEDILEGGPYMLELILLRLRDCLSFFTLDAVIFVVILAFAIVFEKGVLTVQRRRVY